MVPYAIEAMLLSLKVLGDSPLISFARLVESKTSLKFLLRHYFI